jgi:hypothetical protein
MGTMIRAIVAENFMIGPIGANGSNGIKLNVPITQHNIPALVPNMRKHKIHIIETGSIIAIPHPGTLGINEVVNIDTIKDKAPNRAAPDICKTSWDDFDI